MYKHVAVYNGKKKNLRVQIIDQRNRRRMFPYVTREKFVKFSKKN